MGLIWYDAVHLTAVQGQRHTKDLEGGRASGAVVSLCCLHAQPHMVQLVQQLESRARVGVPRRTLAAPSANNTRARPLLHRHDHMLRAHVLTAHVRRAHMIMLTAFKKRCLLGNTDNSSRFVLKHTITPSQNLWTPQNTHHVILMSM